MLDSTAYCLKCLIMKRIPHTRAGLDTHSDSELAFLEDRYSRNAYSKRYFDSWDRPSRSNPLNH